MASLTPVRRTTSFRTRNGALSTPILYAINEGTGDRGLDIWDVSDLIFPGLTTPMAWGANYSAERDLVFTSDMVTGVYTFKMTPGRAK